MIQHPERRSKLSSKFIGPYRVVRYVHGNKFEVMEPNSKVTFVVHSDRLKVVQTSSDSSMEIENTHTNTSPVTQNSTLEKQPPKPVSHTYNLRPRE